MYSTSVTINRMERVHRKQFRRSKRPRLSLALSRGPTRPYTSVYPSVERYYQPESPQGLRLSRPVRGRAGTCRGLSESHSWHCYNDGCQDYFTLETSQPGSKAQVCPELILFLKKAQGRFRFRAHPHV